MPKENSEVVKDQKYVVVKQVNIAALFIQPNRQAALTVAEAGGKGWLLRNSLGLLAHQEYSLLGAERAESWIHRRKGSWRGTAGHFASSPHSPAIFNCPSKKARDSL